MFNNLLLENFRLFLKTVLMSIILMFVFEYLCEYIGLSVFLCL